MQPDVAASPDVVVWEFTLACNLRCRYCGSSAGRARDAELTTTEALGLCDDLHALGVDKVSLMGGEPLVRPDWVAVLERLAELGQCTEIVSNGLLVTPEAVAVMKRCGIYGLSLSLDGPREIHDSLRCREGSFEAVRRAVVMALDAGLKVGILSHLNTENFPALQQLYDTLCDWGVDGWQLQLTAPLGSASGRDCVISEQDLLELHRWAVPRLESGDLHFYMADDIGYFHPREPLLRSGHGQVTFWQGCQAGLRVLGITSDGGVRGCMSLPESYTEASIRERPLAEIWADKGLFGYNREGHDLHGDCAGCVYGKICRGGCSSFGLATCGHVGETKHCIHRIKSRGPSTRRNR